MSSSSTQYIYNTGFKASEFHHAVLSISGNIHTLYLDGSAVITNSTVPLNLSSLITVNKPVIGANYNFNQAFNGIIGDVRVYNQVISATQVSNLYRNRNLIAYYPFDTSVNSLTPNYATLQYDASMIGNIDLSFGFIGTSALKLTNTNSVGVKATQYIIARPGVPNNQWFLNSTTGLTISCWIKVDSTTNTNKIMRIFDIPLSSSRGLGIDISGTNMIYSSF